MTSNPNSILKKLLQSKITNAKARELLGVSHNGLTRLVNQYCSATNKRALRELKKSHNSRKGQPLPIKFCVLNYKLRPLHELAHQRHSKVSKFEG